MCIILYIQLVVCSTVSLSPPQAKYLGLSLSVFNLEDMVYAGDQCLDSTEDHLMGHKPKICDDQVLGVHRNLQIENLRWVTVVHGSWMLSQDGPHPKMFKMIILQGHD